MTTLKEVWEKGIAHYRTPICRTILYQQSEVQEWLASKQKDYDDKAKDSATITEATINRMFAEQIENLINELQQSPL
jgi:hypothetical protein